jgi:hypothetical protein
MGNNTIKSPWFRFHPEDFERDVQILPLAAQGLWIRMLGWMAMNERRCGFLELPTGDPMTPTDIAARVGRPLLEISKCLKEMERVGIFSRDERGCIYCRRMVRESRISEVRRRAAEARLRKEKAAPKSSTKVIEQEPFAVAKSEQNGDFADGLLKVCSDFASAKFSQVQQNQQNIVPTSQVLLPKEIVPDGAKQSSPPLPLPPHTPPSLSSPPPPPSYFSLVSFSPQSQNDEDASKQNSSNVIEFTPITDTPKTEAAIRKRWPSAGYQIIIRVVHAAVQAYLSAQNPKISEPDDALIAEAVEQAAAESPHQTSASLFVATVPQVIKSWCEYGRLPPSRKDVYQTWDPTSV